jgi:hypothetical protein
MRTRLSHSCNEGVHTLKPSSLAESKVGARLSDRSRDKNLAVE